MASGDLDLSKLLPKRYRDKALDTFLRALFNRHLTKDKSEVLYGFVGDPNAPDRATDDIYLVERDLERKINQLAPAAYGKHATEERVVSWAELVQRLVLLGVPYNDLATWLNTQSFNFAPPVDLDKFCNFNEYFWIGKWVKDNPSIDFSDLGLPASSTYVQAAATQSNATYHPEYYVIARGEFNNDGSPKAPYPPLTSWSDWSLLNLWVHRDDVLTFLNTHSDVLSFSDLTPAKLPIIEYAIDVRLSVYVDANNEPADTGTLFIVQKHTANQPPLFDIYYNDGSHTGYTSSILFYKEGTDYPVDADIARRIQRDENNDTVYGVGSSLTDSEELLWFKRYNGVDFDLTNVWLPGPSSTVEYVKYDTSGTVVNRDKFLNFANYFWTASDVGESNLPPYNKAADPEYYVIEAGGTSGWSTGNYWVHVSNLKKADLERYPQAQHAIIEFNLALEPELQTTKTALNQVPKFNIYHLDPSTDTYQLLPTTSIAPLVDAYTEGCLLARLDDLPDTEDAIKSSAEQTSLLFTEAGVDYMQTLVSGYYSPDKDGVTYGYTVREVSRSGVGDGQLTTKSALVTAIPQVLILTALNPTTFSVRSTVFGALPNLTVNVPYTNDGTTFTLLIGATPFVADDVIRVETRSVIFERLTLYVKIGDVYRTFSAPRDIIDKDYTTLRLIPATPALRDGAWAAPPVFSENLDAETRTTINEGDLVYHFSSIIGAQPDLLGSPNGNNNWRSLPVKDYGLGGRIKQHNGRFALLVGLLMQEKVNALDVIDLSRDSYEDCIVNIREYVEEVLADQIQAGEAQPVSNNGDTLDPATYALMKDYLEVSSSIVDSTTTVVDDTLARPYYDSTMPVKALSATLVYQGLFPKVPPARTLDHELNYDVIIHHDGHETKLPSVDTDVLKRLVQKNYHRSNGQYSPGIIGGPIPPVRPFAHQFWLDLSTMTLWTYNVVNDTGDLAFTPADYGVFVSDRQTLNVWEYISPGVWSALGSNSTAQNMPWKKVDLSETYRALLLQFEVELYAECPPRTSPLNNAALEALPNYTSMMKTEFESYAATYGIIDPYASIYDPVNAFTWNYVDPTGFATWHQLYLNVYGTTRPDLEPWFSCGFPDEATFLADAIAQGVIPPGTTSFNTSYWTPLLGTYVSGKQVGLGKPAELSVDPNTSVLLAPFAFGAAQQLLPSVPTAPNKRYVFGDLGPIELFWTRTTDYLNSKAKVYFKLSPMTYASLMWGDEIETNGVYDFSPAIGRKCGIADVQLHGEAVDQQLTVTATLTTTPFVEQTLYYEVVSAKDKSLRVEDDAGSVTFTSGTFTHVGTYATVTFERTRFGLVVGDKATVVVPNDGSDPIVTVTPATIRKLEGMSQSYVHLHRISGVDLSLATNTTWLREWSSRLAYRFNTLIDTDVLETRLGDDKLDPASYRVLLKETEYVDDSWITAMRVTLLRVGTTKYVNGKNVPAAKTGGQPGDDWVFRVDIYNPKRSKIEWYDLDTAGEYQTFFALDASNSQDEWRHYSQHLTLRNANAPFLVTGIQSLVTFMYGYSDRLTEEGFVFNDVENPITDPTTGRVMGWQLLIEQFINQQFLGVEEGSAFLFNPFQRKLWYQTPFGFMTDLTRRSSVISTYAPAVLNSKGKQINNSAVRVFRQDDLTEVVFDTPAYAAHVLTSAYEHVILFDNYTGDEILIFDPFLGQQVIRLFFSGEQQASPNGKIAYSGKYIYNGGMRRNLEASVEGLLKLYDSTNTRLNDPAVERARALLGFQTKDYFRDRNTPEQTEFRFWQGEIKSKGTNTSVLAYLNSESYKTAMLDEYWAYKIAEYGDAGVIIDAEMKVENNDCQTERTNYLFLEADETSLINLYLINGGYDIGLYDWIPYDSFSLYTSEQAIGIEYFDPRGCILVTPDDESRWFRYNDLRKLSYFDAEVLAEMPFTPTSLNGCYEVRDAKGNLVRADCFEIYDNDYISQSDAYDMLPYDIEPFDSELQGYYYEMGDYIPGTNPPEYSPPKFKRLNHSTIQILDPILLNRSLTVIAYGPSFSKYSPNRLYDYQNNTTTRSDIIWWDPARGSHHPEAYKEVDFPREQDPAKYNRGLRVFSNPKQSRLKVWGENEIGKVWWDMDDLDYQAYSDTKLYPDMQERLARWGALADFSSVKVYEWIKSEVEPSAYNTQEGVSGEPAIKDYVSRSRAWWQRPVAWRYSDNPSLIPRAFLAMQPASLKLTLDSAGRGRAILKDGGFDELGIAINSKISGARYTSTTKTDANLDHIFGLARVDSAQNLVVGATTNYDEGPIFAPNALSSIAIVPDEGVLGFRDSVYGQYVLNYTYDSVQLKYYLTLTHLASGEAQTLDVRDVPLVAGTVDSYYFDQLGIKVQYTAPFGSGGGSPPTPTPTPTPTGTGTGTPTPTGTGTGTPTPTPQRMRVVAESLGKPAHDIVLRSTVDVISPITFTDASTTYDILDGGSVNSTLGWVAWNDPSANPNTGPKPPLNKYEPLAGEWTPVGDFLSDLVDDIKLRMGDKWVWFDEVDYTPYKSVWAPWKLVVDDVRTARFCTSTGFTSSQFFALNFTYTGVTPAELDKRLDVYVNNIRLKNNKWTVTASGASWVVMISDDLLSKGDMIRMRLRSVPPTAAELAFNPEVEDQDPLVLAQLAYDYPYVYEERRGPSDGLTVKNYYYWVVNKETPAYDNKMSIKQVAQLLSKHDGTYSVPQVFKFFNQVDGRPNRYGLLSVKLLSRWVRKAHTYKLRLKKNPTLRDDDHDMKLKNVHAEWELLRAYQGQVLPKALWDSLTDTLCGQNSVGVDLPYVPYSEYDYRNASFSSYGLGVGQVMTDIEDAKETVKQTILNTGVMRFDIPTQTLVPDPISYTGFDIEQLDTYLATPESTRAFMGDLWTNAKPKQLNELFFAVLQDLLTKTKELSGMFKTSFIALSEIRTIDSQHGSEV